MWLLHATIEAIFGTRLPPKPGGGATSLVGGKFPCGAGPHGYTVCSSMDVDPVEGDYVFVYLSAEEDIPLSSTRLITYGFVFDSDGDPSNDYVPHPSYPDDYFKDTDRWYTLEYVPLAGWILVCRDATNSVVQEVPTAARAIIRDNVILLVAPLSEFGTAEPSYRVTAFTHFGDYGANPPHDWAGDQHPRVSEGRAPLEQGRGFWNPTIRERPAAFEVGRRVPIFGGESRPYSLDSARRIGERDASPATSGSSGSRPSSSRVITLAVPSEKATIATSGEWRSARMGPTCD